MKKIKGEFIWIAVMILMCLMIAFSSCTQNQRAKKYGGKMTITLEANTKLVNATWKEDNLWILTREMKFNETPETYNFSEKSNFRVLEGEITFVETKK